MWFKNIRIYRFTQDIDFTAESLQALLEGGVFSPCNSQDQSRYGWVPPLNTDAAENHQLVHASQNYLMLCAKKQEKVLPAAVINEALKDKVIATEEREGRSIGRKERQSLKDDVVMELLPKAFTRSSLQYAYIDMKQGHLVIDAASAAKAEELLSALRDSVGSLAVVPLVSKQLPHQMMTQWAMEGVNSDKFDLGDECELADPKESSSVIRCRHQDLRSDEINNLLQAGMIVTKLGLNWFDGVNFILDDKLAIKRLRFADELKEKADSIDSQTTVEQFDIEFSVMTIELSALIQDLLSALGGVSTETLLVDEIVVKATGSENDTQTVNEIIFG